MFFIKTPDNMLMPCGHKQPGAVQTTMQELATKGLASKVHCHNTSEFGCVVHFLESDVEGRKNKEEK